MYLEKKSTMVISISIKGDLKDYVISETKLKANELLALGHEIISINLNYTQSKVFGVMGFGLKYEKPEAIIFYKENV